MKPSSKRTLKKAFLNITAGLCAIVFTGNVIAGECAGQINSALGTATSKVVSTLAEGETEGYARYFESKYNSIAELKAAGRSESPRGRRRGHRPAQERQQHSSAERGQQRCARRRNDP